MAINKPPIWLDKTAKDLWTQLVNLVDYKNPVVYQQLGMLCTFYSQFRQAAECCKTDGLISDGFNGQPRPNPAIDIQTKAANSIIKLAKAIKLDCLPDLSEDVGECSTLDELMK